MTTRRRKATTAEQRLEARTVTLHLSMGAGVSCEAEGVPVPDVPTLIRWAVTVRRRLIAEGLDELIPADVSTVPADRVEVPDDDDGGEAWVSPATLAPVKRVGFG